MKLKFSFSFILRGFLFLPVTYLASILSSYSPFEFAIVPAAHALAAGCSCPTGSPGGGNSMTCFLAGGGTTPAVCTSGQNSTNTGASYLNARIAQIENQITALKTKAQSLAQLGNQGYFGPGATIDPLSYLTTLRGLANEIGDLQAQSDTLLQQSLAQQSPPNIFTQVLQGSGAFNYTPVQPGMRDMIAQYVRSPTPAPPSIVVTIVPSTTIVHDSSSGLGGTLFSGGPASYPGFSGTSTSSGAAAIFDLSKPMNLAGNQRFVIVAGAWGDTHSSQIPGYGSVEGSGATIGLSARYTFGQNFIAATVLTDPSVSSISGTSLMPVSGSVRTWGFTGDLSAGHYFSFWSSNEAGIPLLADGWKSSGLELSGHLEDITEYAGALVTPTTALGGTQAYQFLLGTRVKLSALYKTGNYLFLPFIEGGVDAAPESKIISGISLAAPLATGPAIFQTGRTIGLVQGGLDITALKLGVTFSATAFYEPATVQSVGGRLSMRIPLSF